MAMSVRCAVLLALFAVSATAQELITATNYRTDDGQQRIEATDGQGNVRGEYSYVDPNGKTITVRYTAGKDGFKVEGDHLPVAPQVPQVPAVPTSAPAAPQWNPPQQPAQWNAPSQAAPAPQWNPPQQQAQQPAAPHWSQQPQPTWALPQPQYNPSQQQQQWTPPPPAPQQWNQPQQQAAPQWSAPQQYQQQPQQSNAALQNLQNFPGLSSNSLQQPARSQGGQVSVNQAPGAGFSYTYNV